MRLWTVLFVAGVAAVVVVGVGSWIGWQAPAPVYLTLLAYGIVLSALRHVWFGRRGMGESAERRLKGYPRGW